jgi:hypothetical protein
MASGIKSNGVDLDDLFEPDVKGDGPAALGVQSGGVPLRYAALKYGSKRANVGIANASSDVSNLWAAKGTASYGLPINGESYSAISNRGTGKLVFSLTSAGAYTVVATINAGTPTTLATGTWLPSGGSVGDYAVQFSNSITSQVASGGGSNTIANGATTQSALTTNRDFLAQSAASIVTQDAHQSMNLTIRIYMSGSLYSSTQINLTTSGSGS